MRDEELQKSEMDLKKEVMKMEEAIYQYQFGVTDSDGVPYLAVKDFYLQTLFGPLTLIRKGARVMLSPKTGKELFYSSKVEPETLSDVFEIIEPIRTVLNGEWLYAKKGDIVKLTREEALPLLREGKIEEKKGGITK